MIGVVLGAVIDVYTDVVVAAPNLLQLILKALLFLLFRDFVAVYVTVIIGVVLRQN